MRHLRVPAPSVPSPIMSADRQVIPRTSHVREPTVECRCNRRVESEGTDGPAITRAETDPADGQHPCWPAIEWPLPFVPTAGA